MTPGRDFDAERRRILRRISLLTWGLWGLVLFVALAGGALLAWLVGEVGGLGFVGRWLLAALLLVLVPASVHVVMRLLGRRPGGGDEQ